MSLVGSSRRRRRFGRVSQSRPRFRYPTRPDGEHVPFENTTRLKHAAQHPDHWAGRNNSGHRGARPRRAHDGVARWHVALPSSPSNSWRSSRPSSPAPRCTCFCIPASSPCVRGGAHRVSATAARPRTPRAPARGQPPRRRTQRGALGCPDALRRSTLTGPPCSPTLAPIALDAVHAGAPPVHWEAWNE